jgi:hypothetical protein
MTCESVSGRWAAHARRSAALLQERDREMLRLLAEARLRIHWTFSQRAIRSSVFILSSAEAPHPSEHPRGSGWRPIPLPMHLLLRYFQRPMPPTLPLDAVWRMPMTLFTPATYAQETDSSAVHGATVPAIAE